MDKTPFEERVPEIQKELNKRRNKWTLSTLDYDDVCQIILTHIFIKYEKFDEKRGIFSHWVNRIISSQTKNILRDNLTIYSRPCILGCIYNKGGDSCDYTKSGIQCSECRIYRNWQKKKENHFFIKQTLPLENHSQEVNSKPCDGAGTDQAKKILDEKLQKILKPLEWEMYELLYIKHLSPEDAGKKMKMKKVGENPVPGYQFQLKLKRKVIDLAREIIRDDIL